MPFNKPLKQLRSPRRMRRGTTPISPIGTVGRAHLALNVELTKQAREEDWFHICELRPVLVEFGLAGRRCSGPLTFAHSRKHRGNDPVLDREVARGCEGHHFYVLDELHPRLQERIVRECISRRNTVVPTEQLPLINVRGCQTCQLRLTKTPSHDAKFHVHLNHASLADLRAAASSTVETKTSRRLIEGKIRQLEIQASWNR